MATYFPSSSQRDATPAVYLHGSYPEAPVLPGSTMMYVNPGSYLDTLTGNSQQQSHCMDVPAAEATDSASQKQELSHHLGGSRIVGDDFGAWRDRNQMLVMHTQGDPPGIINGGHGHGLSLSLATQIPTGIQLAQFQYRNSNAGGFTPLGTNMTVMEDVDSRNGSTGDEQYRDAGFLPPGFSVAYPDLSKGDLSQHGMTSIARTVPSSKYLKVAQQLLDEVVNVRKALKQPDKDKHQNLNEHGNLGLSNSKKGEDDSSDVPLDAQSIGNSQSELSNAERQELQSKLTKLLAMLDEIDRRYKQYYHQMQIVVSSFDVIAGHGAAKPYTALAVQTISRHFRCLRDAINGQIRATRKRLGEQETSDNSKGVGITRLRYVDQHLRQQRAFQQFGLMQQHAWRPQRGLPESSVSILRAWLFEHFLHPYPKDSDKIMLARQTGLTRSQVSNWFINARVRLWKPMVEEMYKEETGDIELDSNSSSENATKTKKGDKMISEEQSASSTATERCSTGQLMDSKSEHVPDFEMAGSTAKSCHGDPATDYGLLKLREDQRPNLGECNIFPDVLMHTEGVSNRFMDAAAAAYQMSEVGRFGGGNGVSLTLGLQHCEAGLSGTAHHSFFPMRGDEVYGAVGPSVDPETTDFENMNQMIAGNKHNSFGSSHLLHHFEA